jgi:hypothetical protein
VSPKLYIIYVNIMSSETILFAYEIHMHN